MADFLDVVVGIPRRNGEGVFWQKVGVGFPDRKVAGGYNVTLDLLPLPNQEGKIFLVMRPHQERPQERGGGGGFGMQRGGGAAGGGGGGFQQRRPMPSIGGGGGAVQRNDDLDDELPPF